jgi:hypothetical protein
LSGYTYGIPSGVILSGTLSGVLAPGSLIGEIDSSGGFTDINGYIRSSSRDSHDILSIIKGHGAKDLLGTLNASPQDTLIGVINEDGAPNRGLLEGEVNGFTSATFSGVYTTTSGNLLEGYIEANPGSQLFASIEPRVFYIDSSIPINTYGVNKLRALINVSECGFTSSFADLGVYIKGISSNDLEATLIGIAGQWAIAEDELEVLIKNKVISENWLPFIIDQPAIVENYLPVIITSAPIKDLGGSITGVHEHKDLQGEIRAVYTAGVRRDSGSITEWVNLQTGERKVIRLFFRGDAEVFYHSSTNNVAFVEDPNSYLQIVVESFEDTEEEEDTLLAVKTDVRQCIIDDLHSFPNIDEAIKYAIMCATGEINQELRAYIEAKGAITEIGGTISPIDDLYLKDLPAKYMPVVNDPILQGSISGSGGYSEFPGFVRSSTQTHTETSFTDEMGIKYKPKLVTHATGQVSVVLTKVLSTDSIVNTSTPDLGGYVSGIAEKTLNATISGST